MKTTIRATCVAAIIVLCAGCGKQDAQVQALRKQVADLQTRIAQDEQKENSDATNCVTANLAALASFVEALKKLDDAQASGAITPERAKFLRDVLTGTVPLYVTPDGRMTTNPVTVYTNRSQ